MGVPRDQIKHAASGNIDHVLAALGVRERDRGGYVLLCNPVRGEAHPSLQIWTKPGYEGAWMDHSDRDALKGDVFSLVAYWHGWDHEPGGGFAKAAQWLSAVLGLADRARPPPDTASIHAARARHARAASAQSEKNRGRALALFLKGGPLAGTPAETYLRTRGIDLARLARPPAALRFLAEHPHRESGLSLPCIVALMRDGSGRHTAVHRTWLRPDGGGKADVDPPRKIWPNFAGSVIAIARGHSGMPVKAANEAGIADILVLQEGLEDGLSVAVSDPEPRVWVVGSLGNLAHVAVPRCAHSIIVPIDNDWGKPAAAAALKRGLDHLATFGVPVIPVRSPIGKDTTDLLKAGAA